MGLALHSPPPDSIFLNRHFPPEPPRASRYRGRDRNLLRAVLERPVTGDDSLASQVHLVRRRRSHSLARRPRANHFVPGVLDSEDEIIRLARSTAHLPSDGSRNRVPSLERQNAFRDASTVRAPPARSLSQGCEAEDPEIAELYRLGLLYDDEHLRGSGFDFNAIVRDEPTYTVTTRPTRRSRRARDDAIKLSMDWTFSGLEDDDEVARYLVDPARAPKPTDTDGTPRRGYRMIWRSAPVVDGPQDTHPDDAPAPDRDISSSFASLHRSTHSDFTYDFDDDDEMEWAVLSPGGDRETTTVDAATGTWVVLGDGS